METLQHPVAAPEPGVIPASRSAKLFLEAITADKPCGDDLEYSTDYLALNQNTRPARGTPVQWHAVHADAHLLLERSKDVRLLVWWAQSALSLKGAEPLLDALLTLTAWFERYWAHCHPGLEDGQARTRLLAVNAFSHPDGDGFLRELRNATALQHNGMRLSFRHLEFLIRHPDRVAGLASPPCPLAAGEWSQFLLQATSAAQDLALLCREVSHAIAKLHAIVEQQAPEQAHTLNLTVLDDLMQWIAEGLQPAAKALTVAMPASPAPEGHAPVEHSNSARPALAFSGQTVINSRQDICALIDRMCSYLEFHEPSHPAPLLLRGAQKMIGKSFLELMKDLPPESVKVIRDLAGLPND